MSEIVLLENAPTGPDHRQLAQLWFADNRLRVAAGQLGFRSAEVYERNIRRWLYWMETEGITRPLPNDVLRYVAALRKSGLAGHSVNAYMQAVRIFYRWAETQNLYPAIGRSVRGVKVKKDEPLDCLARAGVAALLEHCGAGLSGLRDRALVQVLFSTGLRLVSAVELDVEDVDLEAGTLMYRGKGDRETGRRAYLSGSALVALKAYIRARGQLMEGAPLFAAVGNKAFGQRLTDRSMRRIVVGLMEAAGHVKRTDGKIVRPRVFSAHSLRRSAITTAYEAQGINAAQTLAGHASPTTTLASYARVQKGRLLAELSGAMNL
jgi:integrase/recombinase XerD